MSTKFIIKKPFYLIVFSLLISISLGILLYGTIQLEKKFEQKMLDISTSDVISISKNSSDVITSLLKDSKDYVTDIKTNPQLYNIIEGNLSILLTKNIKYAYLLYRDKRGVFRFLIDGAPEQDKAFINQKFDIDSPKWLDVFTEKKPILIKQPLLHQLSITYLVPILYKDNVELILAIDFSVEKVEDINQIISVIKYVIISIIFVILLFIVAFVIQTIKYISAKKNAFIDKLTNVYNRNYLQESKDFINLTDYILVALDIDHFKKINDTYGHDVGDKILKQIANTILFCIRQNEDIIVRYGGEEFLALIRTKRKNHLQALNVLERIFTTIQDKKFKISAEEFINVTVSIGVNITPGKSRTFQDAFKLADIALYNAKNKGRNKIEIYSNEQDNNSLFMTINDVKDAIEENRVTCFYQKIIDNKNNQESHYEALLRIIARNGEIITPDKIFPVIKGTFISRNITKKVLEICYEKLNKNQDIYLNVNLNPQDIINDSILTILKNYANEENIANRLGLEIVESEDIINYEGSKRNLLMLKNLGYKLYIDDFGSGYSNFIYLTEINTDYIKIDGSIIKKILEDKVSYLVVKNIVNFAKEANIKVIAEYVKNEEIYNKVKELDIEYSQGYYFHKPEKLD
ncbi:EAL domain-containing protein [Campylobacterota bacterium DY0563]